MQTSDQRQASDHGGAPLAAIVTPVYNGARYLAEALDSVQAQTYPNLVHVVLDNASTDETTALLAARPPGRVPLLVFRNATLVSQCRNWSRAVGLAPAEAAYIRILCHDDALHPTAMARCVEAARADPGIGLVMSSHEALGAVDAFGWSEGCYEGRQGLQRLLRGRAQLMPPQTLFARAALPMGRAAFQEPEFGCFDGELCLDILSRGFKLAFIADPLCMTRVHAESVSATAMSQEHREWFSGYEELLRYGPGVFTRLELSALVRRYRRVYLRRLLKLQLRSPAHAAMARRHWQALQRLGKAPSPLEYMEAVLDWPLTRLGLREPYPRAAAPPLSTASGS